MIWNVEVAFTTRTADIPDSPAVLEFVPVVDGVRLTDRIHDFEQAHGMETRNESYRGLVPAFYRCASALDHYLGRSEFGGANKAMLLGCTCGEWGCWPLLAEVSVNEESVTWGRFEQPHRRD